MFSRVKWIYEIYAAHHSEVSLPIRQIGTPQDKIPGYLEKVVFKDGVVNIRGWSLCDLVLFKADHFELSQVPNIERRDVATELGVEPDVGFQVALPVTSGTLRIIFHLGPDTEVIEIFVPDARHMGRRRFHIFGALLRDLTKASPVLLWSALFDRSRLKSKVKSALGLHSNTLTRVIKPAVLQHVNAPESVGLTPARVTIVIPVYNAFDYLQRCLNRISENTDLAWRLILVEDASSDARVLPWVQQWAELMNKRKHRSVILIENEANKGFVQTANRGLAKAREFGDPVILMNSDAMVPRGWASRLLTPMMRDANVATVTPFSNDAEIFSTPIICKSMALAPGQVDLIDQHAQHLTAAEIPTAAPTGVGFCMAINPRFLNEIGLFDTTFSPGYGEEVDWCNRAKAIGGKHLAATNVFVEHRGGASFGNDAKSALIQRNNLKISSRYPGFDGAVQTFIRSDPLATERLALAIGYLDSHPDIAQVPVFIAHSLGGGAEQYLQRRIARDHSNGAVVLRFGGEFRCTIELRFPNGINYVETNELDDVVNLISRVKTPRLIYSCAVGDADPIQIPDLLSKLSRGTTLEILFHDFFPISPSYTLLDHDNVFRGTPLNTTSDKAHQMTRPDGSVLTLAEWQSHWQKAMDAATQVTVFSGDSRARVLSAYPHVSDRICVAPHKSTASPVKAACPTGNRAKIGILGNIGVQKGAELVSLLSKRLERNNEVDLVLIGRIDPAYKLHKSTHVHGSYSIEEIPKLADRYGITLWLIPSIWPETFSFSTHEALATGLPVLTFDLGAQAGAARAADNGTVLPGTPAEFLSDHMQNRIIQAARDSVRSPSEAALLRQNG